MPDLTPSLDILRRLGLSAPPASPVPNVSREDYDTTVRASQANDPTWKKVARIGIGALGGAAKGLVGTDPSEELKNRIINGVATPDEKAEWYSAGAGQIAGQVSDAGLPFAAINKGPVFHGAPKVFEKFDPTRYDKNDVLGWMTHFAENPEYAESYAMGNMKHGGKAEAPNVIAATPKAQNTLDLVNPNMDDLSQAIASFPKGDYRRKSMIEDFKDARRNPEKYREDLSQTHYPNRDKIPANEIPMFHMAENIRLREGDLEKTPFDAIRYNDMDKKSWAIPTQTPITTPWGAPLNDVPKDLIVTRLPEGVVGKSELQFHPPTAPTFPSSKPKPSFYAPKADENQWGVPLKTDYASPGVDKLFKNDESFDLGSMSDYPELSNATINSKYTSKQGEDLISKAEKLGIDWNKHPNFGTLENEVNKKSKGLDISPSKSVFPSGYEEPIANHPEFGILTKSEAGYFVNGGEIPMSWYSKNFPN